MQDLEPQEANNFTEIPKRGGGFFGFVKNFLVFVLLIGVIVGSFWISFNLGRRILVPTKKLPQRRIQIEIPEPPAEIAGLQKLEDVADKVIEKASVQKAPVKKKTVSKPIPKQTTIKKTVAAAPSGHYYKVQAGVFNNKNNAVSLSKKLNASGFANFIRKLNSGWRVQAGAFRTKNRALVLQQLLTSKGFTSSLIYE